jgi:hypothetical protein
VVKTRKSWFRVQKLQPHDEADVAFINRSMHQLKKEKEDDLTAKIRNLDIDTVDDLANKLAELENEDDTGSEPDLMQIDPPE